MTTTNDHKRASRLALILVLAAAGCTGEAFDSGDESLSAGDEDLYDEDVTPPNVVAIDPAEGAVVSNVTTIHATFDEDVTNIFPENFRLVVNDQHVHLYMYPELSFDTETHTATLVFPMALWPGDYYFVDLLDSITDLAGNPLPVTNSWFLATY